MEEDQRPTFKVWCIERNVPFRDDEDGDILVRDEDLVPYYAELAKDFPKYFYRYNDEGEVPHAMN